MLAGGLGSLDSLGASSLPGGSGAFTCWGGCGRGEGLCFGWVPGRVSKTSITTKFLPRLCISPSWIRNHWFCQGGWGQSNTRFRSFFIRQSIWNFVLILVPSAISPTFLGKALSTSRWKARLFVIPENDSKSTEPKQLLKWQWLFCNPKGLEQLALQVYLG